MSDRKLDTDGPASGLATATNTHTHTAHHSGVLGRVPNGAVLPWRDDVDVPFGFVDVSGEGWLPPGRWVQRRNL